MKAGRRGCPPAPRRRALAALWVFAALAVCAPASAQAPGIAFKARSYFGGISRQGGWMGVRVDLSVDEPFSGSIVIRRNEAASGVVRLPLNIGRGTFVFELPVETGDPNFAPQDREPKAYLLNRYGRTVARNDLDFVQVSPYEYAGSDYLRSAIIGWVTGKNPDAAAARFDMPSALCAVSRPEALPTDWRMYASLDVLVLPGSVAHLLTREQIEALDAWVRVGGRVVVDSTALPMHGACPLLTLFGIGPCEGRRDVTIKYTPTTEDAELNARRHGKQAEKKELELRLSIGPVATAEGGRTDADVLFVATRRGLGSVTATCVGLDAFRAANTATEAEAFLFNLLLDDRRHIASDYLHPSMWSSGLLGLSALEPISVWFVLGYLLLFVVLVCPVERILLARTGRLRWTWITTALIALVFCLMADAASRATRGTSPRRAMLCLHDYAPEGSGVRTTFDCFIPSRARSCTMKIGSRSLRLGLSGAGSSTMVDAGAGTIEFSSPVWSPHFLILVDPHAEAAPFAASLYAGTNGPCGTLRLKDQRFTPGDSQAWLVWRGARYALERNGNELRASGSATADRAVLLTPPMVQMLILNQYPPPAASAVANAIESAVADLALPVSAAANARLVFAPASPPPMPLDDDHALLVAPCRGGPKPAITGENPRTVEVHVVRQIVPVRRPGADDRGRS